MERGQRLNSNPQRLDLDWRMGKFAKEAGLICCINPDAHNVDGLKDIAYGVGIARKGWMERFKYTIAPGSFKIFGSKTEELRCR